MLECAERRVRVAVPVRERDLEKLSQSSASLPIRAPPTLNSEPTRPETLISVTVQYSTATHPLGSDHTRNGLVTLILAIAPCYDLRGRWGGADLGGGVVRHVALLALLALLARLISLVAHHLPPRHGRRWGLGRSSLGDSAGVCVSDGAFGRGNHPPC